MKPLFAASTLALFLSGAAFAESLPATHDGFFLAFGLGFGSGNLDTDLDIDGSSGNMTTSGMSSSFDFRIGGAVTENLILHATLVGSAINEPTTKNSDGEKAKIFDNTGVSLLGVGVTKYFMPLNLFASGSVGAAQFTYKVDGQENKKLDGTGYGFQLKVGKEWWVSSNWALGVAGDFEWASITPSDYVLLGQTYSETDTHRSFGIQFSATFQ